MKTNAKTAVLSVSVLGALGIGLLVPGQIKAQPELQGQLQPQIQLQPRIPVLGLKLAPRLQVAIAPEFRTYLLQTKLKVAPQLLDAQVVSRAGVAFFKLNDGTERPLLPLAFMEAVDPEVENAIPPELTRFAPRIRAAKVTGDMQPAPNVGVNAGENAGADGMAGTVDHRPQMTPVKDQGPRGTCVAFASNAALEPFPSIPDNLSEQFTNHLFMKKENRPACEDGIATYKAADYLKSGTIRETMWAYTNAPPACNANAPAVTLYTPKYGIKSSLPLSGGGILSIKNTALLEAILGTGGNVVLGTHVAWDGSKAGGILDVVINSGTGQIAASRGGHAMVIVGYNKPQRYFIVKNSWGAGYGHGGYLYLSYDYIRTYAKYGYWVTKVFPA